MAVDLRQVRYLAAIAEHGGFTRAAEVLHLSQPTLSQQVRKLEVTLGADLLDRTGRRVRLTDAGSAFLERARVGLREVEAAERAIADVSDLSRGELRLGVTPTFGDGALAAPLGDFSALAPAVRVSVAVGPQAALEERLLDDDLDLVIGFAGPHAQGIVSTVLHAEELHLAIRVDRRGPTGDVDATWLTEQRFALLPPSFATRAHIDGAFEALGVTATVTVESESIGMLAHLVQRTDLATVLPEHSITQLSGLRSIGRIAGRDVVAMHRDGAYTSAAATAFRKLLNSWKPVPIVDQMH